MIPGLTGFGNILRARPAIQDGAPSNPIMRTQPQTLFPAAPAPAPAVNRVAPYIPGDVLRSLPLPAGSGPQLFIDPAPINPGSWGSQPLAAPRTAPAPASSGTGGCILCASTSSSPADAPSGGGGGSGMAPAPASLLTATSGEVPWWLLVLGGVVAAVVLHKLGGD